MSTHHLRLLHAFAFVVLSTLAGGCTSLQSVGVTSIPKERGRPVETSENNVAFLGIHFDNAFADEVPEKLRQQCPDGKITGVFSKYESTWYVLVQNRSVTVKAFCVTGEGTTAKANTPAPATAAPVEGSPQGGAL